MQIERFAQRPRKTGCSVRLGRTSPDEKRLWELLSSCWPPGRTDSGWATMISYVFVHDVRKMFQDGLDWGGDDLSEAADGGEFHGA